MAHIIGIALTLAIVYWLGKKVRLIPNAVKNVLVIGGGFFLLVLQIGAIALLVGAVLTNRGDTTFGDFAAFCVAVAMLMVWNAFLSLNIAQRLMLMGLYKGMREQQWKAAPPYGGGANPRVSWTDYQG
jgi:hypothetical protein